MKNLEQETGIIYRLHFSYSDFILKLDLADYGLDPFTLAPNFCLNCNANCNVVHTRLTASFTRSLLQLKRIQTKIT